MAQQVARMRVTLPITATEEDNTSMDFYFEATGSDTNLTISEVYTAIEFFFNGLAPSQTLPLSNYIATDISRATNACTITATDVTAHLDGSPAGSPFSQTQFTLGGGGINNSMPPSIAVAVGYRRDYGSDLEHGPVISLPSDDDAIDQGAPPTHMGRSRPRARDRGRFYFGPLNSLVSSSLNHNTGTGQDIDSNFITQMTAALHNFLEGKNPGLHDQFQACQWSRRGASVGSAAFFYVNEFFASRRNRADTTLARVHNWVAV